VDFRYSGQEERFRQTVREWLSEHLVGPVAGLGPGSDLGGPDEFAIRQQWERELGAAGWIGIGWPAEYGGRGATFTEQLIFNEEYARAGGPVRIGFFGEQLLGPTLVAFGTEAQKRRFLPPILRGEEYWCQGFSEPDAGSDLANVKTRAVLDGDEWVITGQKVWTSLAQIGQWIFVLCRTGSQEPKHRGLTFLLCPLDQPGVEVRPIRQVTGTAEFNEVFFNEARTSRDLVVGEVNSGWKVAMATLGFERGTAFLAQQLRFSNEFNRIVDQAREGGATRDVLVRQRLADSYIGLQIMRYSGLRAITKVLNGGAPGADASVGKLFWSQWHQRLCELAVDVSGPSSLIVGDGGLDDQQYNFLFSRSHSIYAGSSQIQRNIIGERVLGLARESVRP
jgi:alkylation response protein AidB-like acyl-CoA dehydrogenase